MFLNDGWNVRLREERERLGHSQSAFGEFCGVTKKTQLAYEQGKNSPDIKYLQDIEATGADVMYILTGIRTQPQAQPPEPEPPKAMREAKADYAGLSPRKAALFSLIEALDDAETDDIQAATEKIEQAKALRRNPSDAQFRKAG